MERLTGPSEIISVQVESGKPMTPMKTWPAQKGPSKHTAATGTQEIELLKNLSERTLNRQGFLYYPLFARIY